MGEKGLKLPNSPEGWAIKLSTLLNAVHKAHGTNPFPVKIKDLAEDYSRQVFPDNPITMIEGKDLGTKFEGMTLPKPDGSGEWGIIYNTAVPSKGRINFTLAHEFGHYLLHRHIKPEGLRCTAQDMRNWKSEYGQIEAQANTFASFFLMPLDDFRNQIRGHPPSLELMKHLSDRYQSSLTATILKWLSVTEERAMLVVARDGFIDWSWSSDPLIKTGIYYSARQNTTELPAGSLAASMMERSKIDQINEFQCKHKAGIWLGKEEVEEMTLFYKQGNISLTLLLYPKSSARSYHADESDLTDTFDQFQRNS